MNIIGIEKSSFIDYPNHICTVFFTGGCNFRCPYCHNSPLVHNIGERIEVEDAIDFLKKRKRFVEAVCISGGEPTLQRDLYDFIYRIKKEGLLVKLDTNGTNPILLRKLIEDQLLDYVAMDIKAPLNQYEMVTQVNVNIHDIQESVHILLENKVDYEFRTTLCKELLTVEDIQSIAEKITGCRTYALQNFRDGATVLGGQHRLTPYSSEELKEMEKSLSSILGNIIVR